MLKIAIVLDLHWPYKRHTGIYAGAFRYAQQHHLDLVIDEHPFTRFRKTSKKDFPYAGMIGRATPSLFQKTSHHGIPLVNVWMNSPVRQLLPGVFPNYAAAGQIRAEHLIELGIKNFVALGCDDDLGYELEAEAFEGLLKELGYECSTMTIPNCYAGDGTSWHHVQHLLATWLNSWELPIGVFVSSEILARLIIPMCLSRGWNIPKDVAIIAGTNEPTLCKSPRPTLSSIEFGYERIGYQAAEMLHQSLLTSGNTTAHSDTPPEHRWIPPVELIPRDSTDFYSAHDESVAKALEFIARNFHLSISPIDVSKAVHTELRTLQRRFGEQLDRPISAEIRRVRIERAKRELVQSQSKLSEVARKAGLGSAMHMYDVFRRELGITPSEYRKQRRLPT